MFLGDGYVEGARRFRLRLGDTFALTLPFKLRNRSY